MAYDLTERQREVLGLLALGGSLALQGIIGHLHRPRASATLRDDLYHLKRPGLIRLRGRGRGRHGPSPGAGWDKLPNVLE